MFSLQGIILIGIGRYVEQKNFENLIRAVKILISSGRDVSLILIGEGGQRKNYEMVINELNLKDRVILTGYRDDVAAFLRGSDVLVMPSLYEGFLNVHIEAMYCCVPSVLSHVVPSLEIFSKAAVICDFSAKSIANSIDL
ncbi:glycosyltransferase, partial [Vibrio sp.]|uniref:glycosyltransferase n=1 Tax=Vibrio sp. TaxID=678 RepID=UPI003D0E4050